MSTGADPSVIAEIERMIPFQTATQRDNTLLQAQARGQISIYYLHLRCLAQDETNLRIRCTSYLYICLYMLF